MSNYANEAGEPYMTAAQLRFEAELDEQSAYERQFDDFYDNEPADYYDECDECGDFALDTRTGVCEDCGAGEAADDFPLSVEYGGEDSWLDGSYEE
jgi:hypothetical protein